MHTENSETGVNTLILKRLQFSIIKIMPKNTNQPPNPTTCPRIFLQVVGDPNTTRYLLSLTRLPKYFSEDFTINGL